MRCLWLATVLSLFQLASAAIVNITVDDQNGGPNGIEISYQPPNSWVQGAIGGCNDCPTPAITNLAYMNTFHGSLFNQGNKKNSQQSPPFATLAFFRVSVSVNCILSNELSNPVGISRMTFSIDGVQRDTFTYTPTGSSTFQPATVFSSGPIGLANHTLEIKNGATGGGSSLVILDSITYSTDDLTSPSSSALAASQTAQDSKSTPSSSSLGATKSTNNTAAIAGGVIAAVAVVLLIALAFLYMRYRRNQAHRSNVPLTTSLFLPHWKDWQPFPAASQATAGHGSSAVPSPSSSCLISSVSSTDSPSNGTTSSPVFWIPHIEDFVQRQSSCRTFQSSTTAAGYSNAPATEYAEHAIIRGAQPAPFWKSAATTTLSSAGTQQRRRLNPTVAAANAGGDGKRADTNHPSARHVRGGSLESL
ncbi:hypothetical protein MSAN_00803800 [Mycena sanguinolenta]|uniref:Uncharacterized protein n=1 Tax=Mycena sanguinolenta TaxID=230812 RepID=A0A8H6YY85_9AGAR|nr:hypothetical protein MSAN_00803800 [Mycena sanguinolenta]